MTDEEIKIIENEIRENTEETFLFFPRYKRDLALNNFISYLIVQMYLENEIREYDYETVFDECSTIELASEILESISSSLKKKFIKEYKAGNIIFIDNSETSYSHTYVNGTIKCKITQNKNIMDPITCVHEFLHLLHLETYNNNISEEEYYYFTEILGLVGDLYSIYYLAFIKKEYLNDIKGFSFNIINSMMGSAQESLFVGTVIDVYNKYQSLSDENISKYLKTCDTFEEDTDILELYCCLDEINYFECVRYVYGLPIALQISSDLIAGNKEKYKGIFDKFKTTTPEEILKELSLDKHLTDRATLVEYISTVYDNFTSIFDIKVKEDTKQYGKKTKK